MKIELNGKQVETKAGTVEGLMKELDIKPGMVAVELNLNVVKKCDYASAAISDGDVVEVVNFVGGG